VVEGWVGEAVGGFGREFPAIRATLTVALARYYAERDFYHKRGRWGEGGGGAWNSKGTRTGFRRLERTGTESPGMKRETNTGGGVVTEKETMDRIRKVCLLLYEAVVIPGMTASVRARVCREASGVCIRGVRGEEGR